MSLRIDRRRRTGSVRDRCAALAAALVSLAAAGAVAAQDPAVPAAGAPRIAFNQHLVEGIHARVDVADRDAVLALVFGQLPDTVTVYPSENYYYWSFHANGRAYAGNLRLDALDRDQGLIHLGYFEYDENGKFQDYDGFDKTFGPGEGVEVRRVERFLYTVAYRGKTVSFRLFDPGMAPPRQAQLRPDEAFIGPVFDESGLRFHLVFNTAENRFHYLLDEDAAVPESWKNVGEHVVIGRRTGFAFFLDKENRRKILIAVHGANTMRNNYYDGPFDQLPDNYVEETRIKDWLEKAYPQVRGKIDRFGHFLDQPGVRVTAYAYYVYFDEKQLSFVQSCIKTRQSKAKFYGCITPDPHKDGRGQPASKPAPAR